MDLTRHPDLAERFAVESGFAGGEGVALVVADRASPDGEKLLLKLLPEGADLHEAGLLASLVHPRIPRVLEVGTTADGRPFVLRGLAPGRALSELGTLDAPAATALCTALLEVLAFVHLRGILHRDLKPQNVIVDTAADGTADPWLVDFGLGSRAIGSATGGTPFFAAPEQLLGLEADARADLFSLGATLVAVLVPEVGSRVPQFLRRFPREEFLTALGLTSGDLPAPFDRFVPRLVATARERRFADAQEALEALRHGGSGRPTLAMLALDPATAYGDAILRATSAGTADLRIVGADAEDREAVALQVACRLGDVRATDSEARAVVLRRGGGNGDVRDLELRPLEPTVLAGHLRATVALDAASAVTAAAALRQAGATTAAAASRHLAELVESGAIVPDGASWTWPDAIAGRLDLTPAPEPATPEALLELAARGRVEAAIAAYRTRAVTDSGREAQWRAALSRGLTLAGEGLRALPLAHDLPDVAARCLLELGRVDEAARIADGGEGDALLRVRAAIGYERGDYETGLRALQGAAADDPHNRIVRAWLLTALDRLDDAERELAAALDQLDANTAPFPRATALAARAELARRAGDPERARSCLDEAIALYRSLGNARQTAVASMNLGVVLKDLRRLDEAREALRRARGLFAHVGDALHTLLVDANLGIVQLTAGDALSAVERFDRAIPALHERGVTRPGPLLRAMRARALALAGERERAAAEIRSLEHDSGTSQDARVESELRAARAALDTPATPAQPTAMFTSDEPTESIPSPVFRTFLAINRRLASERDLEKAMLHLLEAAETVTGGRASYLLVERDGQVSLEVASRMEIHGDRAFSRSLANKAISEQRTITAEDAVADRDLMSMPSVRDLRLRSAMCVPFKAASGVVGALYVEHPGRRGAFGDREAEYLEALGDQAAIAVQRMVNEEELARHAQPHGAEPVGRRAAPRRKPARLIGESAPMEDLRRQIDRFARSDLAVLVQGETGTGKELVARLLHDRSARADGAFVSENCSAIPADLMESELFGHVKGAFTGADQDRAGLLELASGGTLFLDEVGDMPLEMQSKLLRALQEQRIRRVGGRDPFPIDVRLVSATHKDLRAMIQDGGFREDLYFRIAAGVIRVPPLRERGADVTLLANHFAERLGIEHGRKVTLDEATLARLRAASFPGNVRELEHVIARAFLLSEGEVLRIEEDLPRSASAAKTDAPWPAMPLAEATYRTIHAALRATGGDKTAAAKLLGISRTALYEKLKREAQERPGGE